MKGEISCKPFTATRLFLLSSSSEHGDLLMTTKNCSEKHTKVIFSATRAQSNKTKQTNKFTLPCLHHAIVCAQLFTCYRFGWRNIQMRLFMHFNSSLAFLFCISGPSKAICATYLVPNRWTFLWLKLFVHWNVWIKIKF